MNALSDWEALVQAGVQLIEADTRNRWTLGDIAILAERHYGERSLKELATAIRIPKHKTLYDYHRVAKFYDHSARAEFVQLSWSHYREAMRMETPDAARAILTEAHDNDWPVAALAREIKKRCGEKYTPEKYLDVVAAITDVRGDLVILRLPDGDGFKLSHVKAVRVAMWQTDIKPPTQSKRELLGAGDKIRRIG